MSIIININNIRGLSAPVYSISHNDLRLISGEYFIGPDSLMDMDYIFIFGQSNFSNLISKINNNYELKFYNIYAIKGFSENLINYNPFWLDNPISIKDRYIHREYSKNLSIKFWKNTRYWICYDNGSMFSRVRSELFSYIDSTETYEYDEESGTWITPLHKNYSQLSLAI